MDNPRKEFSKIYDQLIDKIYRFIFLKVNSQEIAEDLASETFLRVWEVYDKTRNNGDFEIPKIENPRAFLYRIARNLVTDYYRKKDKNPTISTEFVAITDPKENLEEKAQKDSDLYTIRQAMVNLKDDYQNVIIFHYLDDLPIKEVAEMLDKSEENTRVLLHRALKALKKNI